MKNFNRCWIEKSDEENVIVIDGTILLQRNDFFGNLK